AGVGGESGHAGSCADTAAARPALTRSFVFLVISHLCLTPLEQPQEPEIGADSGIPRQGDRAGAGAGAAAAAPAAERRQRVRPRGEGHNGAAIVGGRTRCAAVDAGGAGGDGAAARALKGYRESEATDAGSDGEGGVGGGGEGAGDGAGTAATSATIKRRLRRGGGSRG